MRDLDPDGQPFNLPFNAARRRERDISELLGLAKGMLADGIVNEREVGFLRDWIARRPDAAAEWPTNIIAARLQQYFADGRIDEDERLELADLMADLIGGRAPLLLGYDAASSLPLDVPPPLITWDPDDVYVFTGRFAYGTRKSCEREVIERGSKVGDTVTRLTSFLVVGTFSSRDWAHSSYGRKIQRAVQLRESGFALRIVGEDHWAAAIAPVI